MEYHGLKISSEFLLGVSAILSAATGLVALVMGVKQKRKVRRDDSFGKNSSENTND